MKTEFLRISNRGSNMFQQENNTVYGVNLPIGLRNRGPCIIDCLHSTAEIMTLPLGTTVLEIGLRSNINISGYDTQTSLESENYTASGYKVLNVYDLDNNIRTNVTFDRKLLSHSPKNPFTDMYCSSLPETIQFGLYKIDSANGGKIEKLTNAGYLSFVLKIKFLE